MIKINNKIESKYIEVNIQIMEEIPFPPITIDLDNDVSLDDLVAKLIDLAKCEKKIEYDFVDDNSLAEQHPKIRIVKETLEEIYKKYNSTLEEHLSSANSNTNTSN